jgi:hypothetical protein
MRGAALPVRCNKAFDRRHAVHHFSSELVESKRVLPAQVGLALSHATPHLFIEFDTHFQLRRIFCCNREVM